MARRARGVANRRCVEIAAWMAGLDRKVILLKGRVTMVGGDFVEAAAEQAALAP